MAFRLSALGPVAVSLDEEAESRVRLTQPTLLALLSYLVLARPRGRQSRDTLIALLWPEADQASGRQGLRNALYRLRGALGDDAIVTIGETIVEVDWASVECDVFALERAVAEGRWSDAVDAYQGPLLQGFHVTDAPEFERWLDGERARLKGIVVDAARSDVDTCRRRGDLAGAIRAAERACALSPDDERTFRQYLEVLRDGGDHAGVRRAFDDFAARLKADYDVEPSEETRSLLRSLNGWPASNDRTRQAPPAVATVPPVHPEVRAQPQPKVRRWVWAVVAGMLAVVILASPLIWKSTRSGNPARAYGAALEPGLDARWLGDTALVARYLRGEAQLRMARNSAAARDTFFRLTQDAPFYAPGWAGLALSTMRSGFTEIPPRVAFPRALAAAERALKLDSTLSMAHEVLIGNELWANWNLGAAKVRLDKALALHPGDPSLLNMLATWHRWRGEFDESLVIKRAIASRDPLSTVAQYQITPSLFFAHRCREAVDAYRRLPEEVRATDGTPVLFAALLCAGMRDEAAYVLRDEVTRQGDTSLANLFAEPISPARRDSAMEMVLRTRLDRLFARRREGWVSPERIMLNYAHRHQADSTLMWLDSMYVERTTTLFVVPFDPLMDFLRGDKRFDAFLNRLPWLPELGAPQQRLIDSLRQHAR